MARGVDEGVYEGMTRWQANAYLYVMSALLLGGVAFSAGLVLWLAMGDARRELGRRVPTGRTDGRSAV